ncbi:MAG TPA: hypothetical protein VMH39_10345 [Gemmatimonadaceae bacterium]|nr:hypothetical protein [Gemmatimonadaceae bacterium]
MTHHVQDCHWSVPTLMMPRPYWLSAWDAPWSCWNERNATVLESTGACERCPFWRARQAGESAGREIPPAGAIPLAAAD